MVDEVETAVKTVLKKVDKLRNAHRERSKVKSLFVADQH